MARQLRLYGYFFLSSLWVNWPIAGFVGILTQNVDWFLVGTYSFGFMAAIAYKLFFLPHDTAYFYYNAGISKLHLVIVSFLMNLALAGFLKLLVLLWLPL